MNFTTIVMAYADLQYHQLYSRMHKICKPTRGNMGLCDYMLGATGHVGKCKMYIYVMLTNLCIGCGHVMTGYVQVSYVITKAQAPVELIFQLILNSKRLPHERLTSHQQVIIISLISNPPLQCVAKQILLIDNT